MRVCWILLLCLTGCSLFTQGEGPSKCESELQVCKQGLEMQRRQLKEWKDNNAFDGVKFYPQSTRLVNQPE